MKRYITMQPAAGGILLLLALTAPSARLFSAARFIQSQGQSQQQDQPPKDKDKDKKAKKGQDTSQGAQGNAQGTAQPANSSGGNANPPPASQPAGKPAGNDKPAPLFGGSLNLKSSRQTKDSATMGFNGVDPNGQVQKNFLSAAANNTDRSKAQQVASYKVDPQDLAQFIQDAELNPTAAAPPAQKPK